MYRQKQVLGKGSIKGVFEVVQRKGEPWGPGLFELLKGHSCPAMSAGKGPGSEGPDNAQSVSPYCSWKLFSVPSNSLPPMGLWHQPRLALGGNASFPERLWNNTKQHNKAQHNTLYYWLISANLASLFVFRLPSYTVMWSSRMLSRSLTCILPTPVTNLMCMWSSACPQHFSNTRDIFSTISTGLSQRKRGEGSCHCWE